jgi:hypothetical protein
VAEKAVLLEELKEAYPDVFQAIQEEGGECWSTEEVTQEFDILGFMAPYCVAVRKETGKKGALAFVHRPRIYYGWQEA